MILPEPRNDRGRQKSIATAGSMLLMFGLYAGLRSTPLPPMESSSSMIRQLDPLFLERYAPPPPSETAGDRVAEEIAPDESSMAVSEQAVGSALEDLARRFESGVVAPPAAGSDNSPTPMAALGAASPERDDRFTELFGAAEAAAGGGARPTRRRGARTRQANGGGIGLVSARGLGAATRSQISDEDIEVTVANPTERGAARSEPDLEIAEYLPENFDRMEAAVLTEWIQIHATDLPVGVKVHLNYDPAFLTAAKPFASNGRDFELFLMFNPSLRELHIVLVEGDRSVYMIDRGFQERTRSLRQGTVRRVNGEIVAVDSHAGAASSEQAQEFYNIFLSWWDNAKTNGPQ